MKWYVTTKNIDEIVEATDHWEAFDSVRGRNVSDFGLIVEVQPVNETSSKAIGVRSSALFSRWGKPDIARQFIEAAIAEGLPDTSDLDVS